MTYTLWAQSKPLGYIPAKIHTKDYVELGTASGYTRSEAYRHWARDEDVDVVNGRKPKDLSSGDLMSLSDKFWVLTPTGVWAVTEVIVDHNG